VVVSRKGETSKGCGGGKLTKMSHGRRKEKDRGRETNPDGSKPSRGAQRTDSGETSYKLKRKYTGATKLLQKRSARWGINRGGEAHFGGTQNQWAGQRR